MESADKRIANILRTFVWYSDYALFKILHPITKKLPGTIKGILVVELLFIGDVIVTTPTIRALKKAFPDAKITMLLLPGMDAVISGNPNVDEILTFSKDEIKSNFNAIANSLKNRFDLGILLHPGSFLISKLLYKANVSYRIGCTKVGFAEGKGFFLHKKTRPSFRLKHKIDDNLDVIKTIGVTTSDKSLEIYATKESEAYIRNKLEMHNINRYILIHASPQHKTHEWPNERFAAVADALIEKYKIGIIFSGSEKDILFNNQVITLMKHKAYNFADTSIKQFFALIKQAEAVISVDTSAMHVAAAFNKPVVSLFGAGNPKIWKPYCSQGIILYNNNVCTSCMKHKCRFKDNRSYECMKAISVNDVLNAVEALKI